MNFSIELVSAIGGLVLTILWLAKLEARGAENKNRLAELSEKIFKLEEKHEALDSRIVDKLSYIERSLAKIEGRLSIDKKEV